MKSAIVQVVVGLPVPGPFDYQWNGVNPQDPKPGMRVKVSFGPRQLVGVVVGTRTKSSFKKLKPVLEVLDSQPILGPTMLDFCRRVSEYYGCSLGEAILLTLPNALRQPKRIETEPGFAQDNRGEARPLSVDDRSTKANPFLLERILLHDPAGTKRWPLILEAVKKAIAQDRGVIFLVPEISRIAQVVERLRQAGDCPMVELDKKISNRRELENWLAIKSGKACVAIGSRFAVFAPFPRMGLIVMDDEEHSAYKQEQSPFYHTRDVMLLRSRLEQCSVIFASGAPTAELWWLAQKKPVRLISLPQKAKSHWQLVDLGIYGPKRRFILSVPLRNSMEKILQQKGKTLLWLNRKGFSSVTRCQKCGFSLQCPHCDVNLTYSYSKKKMICRRCQAKSAIPAVCPSCHSSYLRYYGIGVEKLESEVSRLFPQARVEHFDADSPDFPNDFDILIATQAVMGLLDHGRFDLVGIVQVDAQLSRMDFRSGQKTFSLLTQLRYHAKQKLLVQTRVPDNYCLQTARKPDFKKFYQEEIRLRQEMGFPPFQQIFLLGFRSFKEESALEQANLVYEALREKAPRSVEISEPQPDIIAKLRDKYRFTLMIKGKKVQVLLELVEEALGAVGRKSNVITTINPDYSPMIFLKA